MSAVLAWARLDVRRRWRSLLVLTLLVSLSSAVVLAALAGARRTDTALPRLQERVLPADVMVLPNQPGFDWSPVSRLSSVETLGTFALTFAPVQLDIGSADDFSFPAADAQLHVAIDRPTLLRGRHPDPNNPREALASPGFIEKYGEFVTATLPTAAQLGPDGSIAPGTKYAGPSVRIRIVGEGKNSFTLVGEEGPTFALSYGFFRMYMKPVLPYFANARVRLRGGQAAIPRFRRELAAATGSDNIDVLDLEEEVAALQRSATFVATGWLCFALVALLASLVLVGQAFGRYCAASGDELRTLRALGLDRRQSRLAAAFGPALAGVAGSALGVAGAVLASPLFPTGAIRIGEPAPGIRVDPLAVLGGGAALAAIAVIGSWLAARIPDLGREVVRERRSTVAAMFARAGLGVVPVLGARLALEPGRGKTRVPVRPALVGAIAGVIGVVGAFTFRDGLDGAVADPARFGQTLPHTVFLAFGGTPVPPADEAAVRKAAASPLISVLVDLRVGIFPVNDRSVSTYSLDPLKGDPRVVALSGRPPAAAGEISLAPATADALGVGTGDSVSIGSRRLRVSGITFVPEGPHNDYSDGAWLTRDGFAVQQPEKADDKFRLVSFDFAPGVSAAMAIKELGAFGQRIEPSQVPSQVEDLRDIRLQPLLLGGFLLLLALGAVGHALATAVRRRRHDVAVLRSLGLTRRQSRLIVAAQASVIGAVGLIFGLALGVAAGRTSWRALADATPVLYVAPLTVLVLALAVPATLAVANTLAALPARRAARLEVAQTLRAE